MLKLGSKRIVLVNREFQFRYAGVAVVVGILSTVITAFIVLYPLFVFGILRIPRFLPWPVLFTMLSAVLVNVAIIAVMGIYITHKIAGPVFGMVRHLHKLETGRWGVGPLKVRQGDELKYLVRNYNGFVNALVATAKRYLAEVEAALASLSGPSAEDQDPKVMLELLKGRMSERLNGHI